MQNTGYTQQINAIEIDGRTGDPMGGMISGGNSYGYSSSSGYNSGMGMGAVGAVGAAGVGAAGYGLAGQTSTYQTGGSSYQTGGYGYTTGSHVVGGNTTTQYTTTQYQPATTYTTSTYQPAVTSHHHDVHVHEHGHQEAQIVNTTVNTGK